MTPSDSGLLDQLLDDFEQAFDPEVSLLWQAKGKVHDHKASLAYAMALLKRGRDADIERASRIVKQALTTQNTIENSHRYGNFKWVYEDKSVTDINAVQFCLWSLIELLRNFTELLGSETVEAIRQAIAIGLIEEAELDVPWHYTNIFLIQTGNQILGAELLGQEHRHHGEHGYQRLQEWIDHSNRNGAVYEYNSPGYCAVDIDSLARISMHCQRTDMAIKARIMEERIWIHVAMRFHPGTLKLAGPYARAYHPAICGVPLGIYDHFYQATGNEDILRPSPYGDSESYHARAYRGFRAFKYEYDLPDYIGRLITEKPLPYSIREQADKSVGNDITTYLTDDYALGTNAKTYQETEQAQPGLWTPLCKSLVLHYRRPEPYHFGVLYSLYVVNDKRIADYYHKIHVAPDGIATADRYQDERALVRAVQDKNRAIVLYHPPQLKEDVFSLRVEVIVLGRKGIDCIMIGDTEVTSLPAKFNSANILFLKENGAYIAVLPLEPSNLGEEDAPTIELTEDKHGNLVYSIYNYQGPAKPFWEYKTPLPYFKSNTKAGFILEVGSAREFDSFNQFREHIRRAKINDVTTIDHLRQVSYENGNDTIALTVDLKNNALIDRHINGAVYQAPDLTADTVKQDTSGKIELAGARLLTDPRTAWLLVDKTLGAYVAATPSPQGGPLRLETPSGTLECADFGFGRIAYYSGDSPRLDLLATDLGSPIYFSRQGETAPVVHLNGENVSSKITSMEKDGETVCCIPAGQPQRLMKTEYVTEELLSETWNLVLSKITGNAQRGFEGGYPHYTDPKSGDWITLPPDLTGGLQDGKWNHGNWTAGFWPGLLWLAYAHTKDKQFKRLAFEALEPLKARTQDTNTHDIGFLFHSAVCLGCDLTGDPELRATGLATADTLADRFNPKGQYIQAWGPRGDEEWIGTSTIDTMMNLPLLWWAFQETKSECYREVAAAHAKTTLQNLVRGDHSTVHLGIYDPGTGQLKKQTTFQGFRDDSCWARGQSWGIYGFAQAFEHTGHEPFLQAACRLADYFLGHLPTDLVPYYDFDAPVGPDTPRDSSAAAIAAGGLLQLAETGGDPCVPYRQSAHRILASLSQNYLDHENQTQGIVKHACYSKPHSEGVDSCFIVGDYFFIKALHQLA